MKFYKNLDPRKSPTPDLFNPFFFFFFKLTADFVADPLAFLFNLTLERNESPSAWKSDCVLPLFKGGNPAILTNYRPISNLSVLAKLLDNLASEQDKLFLYSNSILSNFQSGFKKKNMVLSQLQ